MAAAGCQGPDDASAPSLGDVLVRVVRALERTGAQLAARRRDGLDRAAHHVLFRLLQDGPQRAAGLAESMQSDPSTVSRHAAHLVAAGLVERTSDPTDGRATLLAATDRGAGFAQVLRARRDAVLARVVADWPADDRAALAHLLARFAEDLDHARPQVLADAEHDHPLRGEP